MTRRDQDIALSLVLAEDFRITSLEHARELVRAVIDQDCANAGGRTALRLALAEIDRAIGGGR